MGLTVKYLKSSFASVFDRMLFGVKDSATGEYTQRGVPLGSFWDKKYEVVPFTAQPTNIIITPVRPYWPIKVTVSQPRERKPGSTVNLKEITVIPTTVSAVASITLGQGHNIVTVDDGYEKATIVLNARNYATILFAYAAELEKYVWGKINNQDQLIFNSYSTSLVEPLIDFQEYLPSVKSLNRIGMRFATRALFNESMSDLAVRDMLTALTANTPYFQNAQNTKEVDPTIYTIYTAQEDFAGIDAHVWITKIEVSRWLAFSRLSNNLKELFRLKDVNAYQVTVDAIRDGTEQKHRFDFAASADTLTSAQFYPKDYNVILYIKTKSTIKTALASYEFDLYVDEKNPLGGQYRLHFDMGVPLDDSRPFDSDPVDLHSDGFVGFRLTGRMEQDHPPVWDTTQAEFGFDSLFKTPGQGYGGPPWVYPKGYYTQNLFVQLADQQIDVPLLCAGTVTGGTPNP